MKKKLSLNILFLSLCAVNAWAAPTSPTTLPSQRTQLTEMALQVNVNKSDNRNLAVVYKDQHGNLYIREKDLMRWKILLPPTAPTIIADQKYYNVNKIPGLTHRIDKTREKLFLTVPTKELKKRAISFRKPQEIKPQAPTPGGFLNYDIFAQKTSQSDAQVSGLFEGGFFNSSGVGITDFLVSRGNDDNKTVRLNSTWTIDLPKKMQTLRLGDTFSSGGMWGNSVDMGGVQWNSNFNTNPNFISFPLPTGSGNAVLPSTVDVYLDNALIGKRSIDSGPFSLDNIPVVTGAGDLQLVVTNLLGKQQVVNIPYYADNQLLKPGLHNFSFEAGFIRRNFGEKSFDYGDFLINGTDTFGITDHLTAQWHAELRQLSQALGFGANYLIGDFGIVNAAAAISHHLYNYGELFKIGFTRQARKFSFGGQAEFYTKNYQAIGIGDNDELAPKMESQLFASYSFNNGLSIGAGYAGQINRGEPNESILSGNVAMQPARDLYLTLSALTSLTGPEDNAFILTTTLSLAQRTVASVSGIKQNDNYSLRAQYQHNAPTHGGFGYNVSTSIGDDKYINLGGNYDSQYGYYSAQFARQAGITGYQFEASGGLAFVDDKLFMTQYLSNSFALINAPNQPGLPIYLENNLIGKTNKDGNILIPNLNPYIKNKVSIRTTDLPLEAQVKAAKLTVVPYFRSAAFAKFPISTPTSGVLTVKLPNGKYVPTGANLKVAGTNENFAVGFDGRAFITGFKPKNKIIVTWYNQRCDFAINHKDQSKPNQNLGTYICQKNHGIA